MIVCSFKETVLVDFGFNVGGELLHRLAEDVEQGGVGGVGAVGVHLLFAALGDLGALEVETDVVVAGVGVGFRLLVVVAPQLAPGGKHGPGFGRKVVERTVWGGEPLFLLRGEQVGLPALRLGGVGSVQIFAHKMTGKVVLRSHLSFGEWYPMVDALTTANAVLSVKQCVNKAVGLKLVVSLPTVFGV